MAIMRINKNKNYTIMSNFHLRDKELSLKAKGLLSLMLSLPEDWDYSYEGLIYLCRENETCIKSALKELKDLNYLVINKVRNDKGQYEYLYDIFESPEHKKPEVENPPLDNPPLDNPTVENQGQYITNNIYIEDNILYKDILNTNNKDIYLKEKRKKKKENENTNIYAQIIDYLNKKTNSNYRSTTPKTRTLINARINEKFTYEDFIKVIDKKCNEWLNTDMQPYLRPETLFGTKFESYLNQKENKSLRKDLFNDFGGIKTGCEVNDDETF